MGHKRLSERTCRPVNPVKIPLSTPYTQRFTSIVFNSYSHWIRAMITDIGGRMQTAAGYPQRRVTAK